jgi:Fe2+ or Zn2+ uptake regulation protein
MMSHGEQRDQMVAQMRNAGMKITPQRLAIVEALAGDPSHPTAQELFDRLRPRLPTMSFATVYNTLAALSDAGLCVARPLTRGSVRFDPNTSVHDHCVCDACGRVVDVPGAHGAADFPPARAASGAGFRVRAVERIYRGLCAGCAGSDE